MTSAVHNNQAFVRAKVVSTFHKQVEVPERDESGEAIEGTERKVLRLDLTMEALEYGTPLKLTIWDQLAKDLKGKVKDGTIVEISGYVFADEWKVSDDDRSNSFIKLGVKQDLLDSDDEDTRHYVEIVSEGDDAGVIVNIAGEVVWVGEPETRGSDDNSWEVKQLLLCPHVERRDGTVGRSKSIRLELHGDNVELDVKTGQTIGLTEATIVNRRYEDKDSNKRSEGMLRTVQDTEITISKKPGKKKAA